MTDKLDVIVLKAARYILELSECTESSYSLVEAVTVVYALTKVIYQPDCKLRGGGRSSSGAGFVLPLQIFAPAKRMCHHENFEDRAERIILNLIFGAFVGIILYLCHR